MSRFDPATFWRAAGRNPHHREHESRFQHTLAYAVQEERLLAYLATLTFASVLEAGAGWGRITRLVRERWPNGPYLAFDPSPERIASLRRHVPNVEALVASIGTPAVSERYDLVLCVETLMHIPPDQIVAAIAWLRERARGALVTLDWSEPIKAETREWNWRHDYEALGLRRVETIGAQAIFTSVG
jgi:trans-aconitate methyltransferase